MIKNTWKNAQTAEVVAQKMDTIATTVGGVLTEYFAQNAFMRTPVMQIFVWHVETNKSKGISSHKKAIYYAPNATTQNPRKYEIKHF
jgi:hypothetical protein